MAFSLQGKNVVITGGLRKMTRQKAHAMILAAGGYPRKKVSSRTDILVVADDFINLNLFSEKREKYLDLKMNGSDIEAITEAQFYSLI